MRFYEFKTVLNQTGNPANKPTEQVPTPAPAPAPAPTPPIPLKPPIAGDSTLSSTPAIIKKAEQVAGNIDKMDLSTIPEPALQKANTFVKNLLTKIQQKVSQLTGTEVQTEDAAGEVTLNSNLETLMTQLAKLCGETGLLGLKKVDCSSFLQGMGIEKMDHLQDFLITAQKQEREGGYEKGSDDTKQAYKAFKKSLNTKIDTLVKKAEGIDAVVEWDRKNISAVQTSIRERLKSIVDHLEERDITPQTIDAFLDLAIAGKIIDMKSLVSAKSGNIDSHINEELPPDIKQLFDNEIKDLFFKFIPGGTTAGNYGPTEVALAILGNPAKKADTGDLEVDGTMFELKGSGYDAKGNPGSLYGARLNSKGISAGPAGWGTLDKEIKKMVPKIKGTNTSKKKDAVQSGAKVPGYLRYMNGTITTKGIKWKEASRYNFNGTGLDRLNNEILGPVGNPKKTFNLLTNTFKEIVTGWKKVSSWDKRIKGMINSDGTVGKDKLFTQYSAIAYDSYNKEDSVENILFVNSSNRNYYLVSGKNPTELLQAIKSGEIIIKGGISWNDDQQKATPQYSIK